MSRAEESTPDSGAQAGSCISRFWTKYIKVDDAWLREVRGHLITAATLTATMAYQSILSPPGSFWQESAAPQNSTLRPPDAPHRAGQAIWDTLPQAISFAKAPSFELFVDLNTLQLGASLSTVMLAMAGFPPENKFLTWLLVFSVYVTVSFMAVAHLMAISFVSVDQYPWGAITGLILGWGFVCTFVLVLHSSRFLVWLWKNLAKLGEECCRFWRPTSRPNQNSSTGEGNKVAGSHWRTSTAC